MKKSIIFTIFILLLVFFIPCNSARVFASEEKNLKIYDFCLTPDGYLVLVEDYTYTNDIINAYYVNNTKLVNLCSINNGLDLRQPTLISSQSDCYAIFDYGSKKVNIFNFEKMFLYSINEYIAFNGLNKNIDFIDMFGYDNKIYAINFNQGLKECTYSLVVLNENENKFYTLCNIESFSMNKESKLFVNENLIYFSCQEGIIEYDIIKNSFTRLLNNQNYDYFFTDCKNKFHYLKNGFLDNENEKLINYSENIEFDKEKGSIYFINESVSTIGNSLNLYALIKSAENIVDSTQDFVAPNSLEDYKLNSLEQIKKANNLSVYNSPYSSKEQSIINQNVIVIGMIEEDLNEPYSYIVYNQSNKTMLGYVKTNLLKESEFLDEKNEFLATTNYTKICKNFDNKLIVGYLDKKEIIKPLKTIIENNEEYFIINYEDELAICKKSNFVTESTQIKPLFIPNSYLNEKSEITILNQKESKIISLNKKTPIQIQTNDEKYVYFLVKINGDILTCKSLKSNIFKQDYSVIIISSIIIFVSILVLCGILFILLKKNKKMPY